MRFHRSLSEMLSEIFEAVLCARAETGFLRARSVELSLPIEASLESGRDGEPALHADLPVWRWRTDFDLLPGRLRLKVEELER